MSESGCQKNTFICRLYGFSCCMHGTIRRFSEIYFPIAYNLEDYKLKGSQKDSNTKEGNERPDTRYVIT